METPEITILLLGNDNVGKTTFLSRISQGEKGLSVGSPIKLLRDIDQPYVFDTVLFKRPHRFEFYDTASPENWKRLQPNVVILCYDIANRLSLVDMQRTWMKEVVKTFSIEHEIPVLVLGLKRDLRSEEDPNGIIYPQEAYRISQEMRCDKYMECSAVTGDLVYEVFEDICRTAALSSTSQGGGPSHGGLSDDGCYIM